VKDVVLKLAERVDSGEIIFFLLITVQAGIIIYLIQALRKKDGVFLKILDQFHRELGVIGNQLTQLIGIVDFLAFYQGLTKNDVRKKAKTLFTGDSTTQETDGRARQNDPRDSGSFGRPRRNASDQDT